MNFLSRLPVDPVPSRVLTETVRRRLTLPHRCDLYAPEDLRPIAGEGNPSGIQTGDGRWRLAARDVPCLFSPRPETDQPTVLGRTQADNIFTLDVFFVPSGVEIHDAWLLVFLGAGDNHGEVYAVQGEPQSDNPHPLNPAQTQQVFCKRIPGNPLPPGVDVPDPLGEGAPRPLGAPHPLDAPHPQGLPESPEAA